MLLFLNVFNEKKIKVTLNLKDDLILIKSDANQMKQVVLNLMQKMLLKIIYIKKHSNDSILIYDKNNEVIYSKVKPILREVNSILKLNIDLKHSSGSLKVTRTLGREIINKLKK